MEIEDYDYTIDDIDEDAQVVTVTYTALDARLKPVTRNVSVPFHKASDEDHAEQIMHQKIRSRAPTGEWAAALDSLERRTMDPKEAAAAVKQRVTMGARQQIRKPERKSREERLQDEMLTEEARAGRPGREPRQ